MVYEWLWVKKSALELISDIQHPKNKTAVALFFNIFVPNFKAYQKTSAEMRKRNDFDIRLYCTTAILLSLLFFAGCSPKEVKLPYLGNPIVKGTDTVFPTIAAFEFTDQNKVTVTNTTFENKIYIADFIFLSCPTICPKMTSEMKAVYDIYKENPAVLFLSHTIDPERDTVERLKSYTESMDLNANWHFVTGKKEALLAIAEKSYFTTAYKDTNEPGGYVHGGGLMLVDDKGHIRGVYDGTNNAETQRLISDIKILLKELKA